LPNKLPFEKASNAGKNTDPIWYNPVESSRIWTSNKAMSINIVCIVKGGREGLGFAVLKRLSLSTRSLKTCNIVSKSVFFSFFGIRFGKADEPPSADRDGLPNLGECAGEFDLEDTGEAVGVRSLQIK
jgi:hypothetical protein